mmetsp:Transcript_11213/g.15265  ORF Transcript_11213/g.15265 Transcript_11213/m.15265 type:complete len:204 (-) Transcript_11213:526-1137(-)
MAATCSKVHAMVPTKSCSLSAWFCIASIFALSALIGFLVAASDSVSTSLSADPSEGSDEASIPSKSSVVAMGGWEKFLAIRYVKEDMQRDRKMPGRIRWLWKHRNTHTTSNASVTAGYFHENTNAIAPPTYPNTGPNTFLNALILSMRIFNRNILNSSMPLAAKTASHASLRMGVGAWPPMYFIIISFFVFFNRLTSASLGGS